MPNTCYQFWHKFLSLHGKSQITNAVSHLARHYLHHDFLSGSLDMVFDGTYVLPKKKKENLKKSENKMKFLPSYSLLAPFQQCHH